MIKKKIVLLQHYFNEIGGIETFLINFCKKLGNEYDLILVCRHIDYKNAFLIGKYADIITDPRTPITCDICIITSVLVDESTFQYIKYKELYQMIHSDWSAMKNFWDWKFKEYDPNTKYISVSEAARQSFIKEYHRDSIVIPNIVSVEQVELRLLSLTRLTEEKGFNRMIKLCQLLDSNNISYIWNVYGTNPNNLTPPKNMYINKPIQLGNRLMKGYDYLVQLSDTESMCISMYEALMQGLPVLVTPFPNAVEEIHNGENGYILPFNMDIDSKQLNNIVHNIPTNVSYKQTGIEDLWKNILK
jgi:glycosyltransferase involved in cell wall biosynthesis